MTTTEEVVNTEIVGTQEKLRGAETEIEIGIETESHHIRTIVVILIARTVLRVDDGRVAIVGATAHRALDIGLTVVIVTPDRCRREAPSDTHTVMDLESMIASLLEVGKTAAASDLTLHRVRTKSPN